MRYCGKSSRGRKILENEKAVEEAAAQKSKINVGKGSRHYSIFRVDI
jgi:hypothetical protein